MSRPSIVILSAFFSPFRSGAEACAEEVSARLTSSYDVTVITARLRKDLPMQETLPSGVVLRRIGFGHSFDKWLYPFLAPIVVRKLRPTIIHAILETFAGLALCFCAFFVPAKRVLTLQTTNRSFLKRFILLFPHRVTAISSALRSIAQSLGRKDVILIPNGIDLCLLQDAARSTEKIPKRILFVGRLEHMKGVDILLRAMAALPLNAREGMSVRIVGDGSERMKLEQLSIDLGLSNVMKFLGYLQTTEVAREMAAAQIFCGLSRSEALGNVFLEAQAAGCAVVATDVGGIPDIVHHEIDGLLVPPDNISAAQTALHRLLTDDALRIRLSTSASQGKEVYDWERITERYREVYSVIL